MDRAQAQKIMARTLAYMAPGSPASRIWGRAPGAEADQAAEGNVWAGDPTDVADVLAGALFPDVTPEDRAASPLAQAEAAKRSRDLVGELTALTAADDALTSAPWYPVRPGDLLHVHYEQAGQMPAFGETYIVGDASGELLSLQLLAHTCPDAIGAGLGMVGCFAVDAHDDPLYEPWFEAGPHLLTIVRDGRVVHGGAR
jgi:hypothetical protein